MMRASLCVSCLLPLVLGGGIAPPVPDVKAEPMLAACGELPDAAKGEWFTWNEIQAKIAAWKHNYPQLVQETTLGKTLEGRDIPLLRLSDTVEIAADEPEVLLMAGIHPREQAPQTCLLRFVDELLAGYGKDARLTRILRERQIWIVPVLNVDGKIHDLAGSKETPADWRKNRRPNSDGTFGVDLNRNFAVRWGGGRQYDPAWKTDTTDPKGNIYEGRGPLSEPESRALSQFLSSRKNLRAFLDIHSPLRVLLFPAYTVSSEYDRFHTIARGMQARQKQPYPISQQARPDTEPVADERGGNSGLTYTWAYYTQGIYSFNMELGTPDRTTGMKGRYPSPADIAREFEANVREPLLFFLEAVEELKPATAGNLMVSGMPRLNTAAKPGAVLTWTPPDLPASCAWAVLVSGGAEAVVQSEYRRCPLTSGFTIKIDENARPGTLVPLTLYLWESDRKVTPVSFTVTIADKP